MYPRRESHVELVEQGSIVDFEVLSVAKVEDRIRKRSGFLMI